MARQARLQIVIDALNEASDELKQIRDDLTSVGESSDRAGDKQEGFLKRLSKNYMNVRLMAMDAVDSLQRIWDFAEEGAAIELSEQRFDRLAESIGTTADALKKDLAAATRGMVSDAGQVRMGADLMSLGLAKTHDDVVRLSRVSSALGMDMNQLVLTLANQTTMRFDQLGVSIDGFDERLEALKQRGLSTNEAFTEAFLQQAEAQIDKLGDASETTAGKMKRFDARLENIGNALKSIAADGVDTALTLIEWETKINEAYTATSQKILENSQTYAEYQSALEGTARAAGYVHEEFVLGQGMVTQYDDRVQMLTAAEWDLARAQMAAEAEQRAYNDSIMAFDAAGDGGAIAAEFFAQAIRDKAAADAAAKIQAELHADAIKQQSAIARDNQKAIADYANTVGTLAMRLKDATDAEAKQELAKAGTDALKEARDKGVITNDQYLSSLTNLQLGYGLATEKSLAMGEAQATLDQLLETGAIPADIYVASIGNIPKAAADGEVSLDELVKGGIDPAKLELIDASTATGTLREALEKLPRKIKIEIELEQTGGLPSLPSGGGSAGVPSRAMGGPVSEGWWYLHDDEYVLSRAMREGRQSIPGEAAPLRGLVGANQVTVMPGAIRIDGTGLDAEAIAERVVERLGQMTNAAVMSGAGMQGL